MDAPPHEGERAHSGGAARWAIVCLAGISSRWSCGPPTTPGEPRGLAPRSVGNTLFPRERAARVGASATGNRRRHLVRRRLASETARCGKACYLWLNQGVWGGQHIVSVAWVEDAVKPHSKAGEYDYGYGWWVSNDSYRATGRGDQNIKVAPAFNVIVVTTGGGFEYDEISPYLTAAVIDPAKPLPANPVGVARLDAALTALVQPLPPSASWTTAGYRQNDFG